MADKTDQDIDVTDVDVQLAVADLFGVGSYSLAKTGEKISDEERQQRLAEHLVETLDEPDETHREDQIQSESVFDWGTFFGQKPKHEAVREAMTKTYNINRDELIIANENQSSQWTGWKNIIGGTH